MVDHRVEWQHNGWISELRAPPWVVHVTEGYFAFILLGKDGKEWSRPIQSWSIGDRSTTETTAMNIGRQVLAYAESLPGWPLLDLINR